MDVLLLRLGDSPLHAIYGTYDKREDKGEDRIRATEIRTYL